MTDCTNFERFSHHHFSLNYADEPAPLQEDSGSDSSEPSGAFFCVLTRPGPWYNPLRKLSNDKAVEEALEPVTTRYACIQAEQDLLPAVSSPQHTAPLQQSHKYVFNAAGVAVCPGVVSLTSELLHVSPYVQHDEASQRIVVFFGWLSNVSELLGSAPATPSGLHEPAATGAEGADTEPCEQTARVTTRALLRLYDRLGPGQEMLMLSELQGQFAFVILDAAKRMVFAARDASGEEDLYYAVGDDGALMFTNSLDSLPPETARHAWQVLPPGHYMAGKDPTPVQYALSRSELAARERQESCLHGALDDAQLDVRLSFDGSSAAGSMGDRERTSPAAQLFKRLSKPLKSLVEHHS